MATHSPRATAVPRVALAARSALYLAVWLASVATLLLSTFALVATLSSFYGFGLNSTVELIASGAIAILVLPPLHLLFHRRPSPSWAASVWFELVTLVALFALFLGGAAATSRDLVDLPYWFGDEKNIYSLTTASMALAWVTWVLVWLLITLVLVLASRAQKREGTGVWKRRLGGVSGVAARRGRAEDEEELRAGSVRAA